MTKKIDSEPKQQKDLIQQHEILIQRVKTIQMDVTAAQKELAAKNEMIADAQPSDRSKLILQRGAMVDQNEALEDVLKILIHRRDVAHLAIFEFREHEAESVAKRLSSQSRDAGIRLQKASIDLQKFHNAPTCVKSEMTEAKRDAYRTDLEMQLAKFKAEASIAHRDAVRAGFALEKARAETKSIREELGIQE